MENEHDVVKRFQNLNEILQELQVDKRTLAGQVEAAEAEIAELRKEVKAKYGIDLESISKAVDDLKAEIEGKELELEKLVAAKEPK